MAAYDAPLDPVRVREQMEQALMVADLNAVLYRFDHCLGCHMQLEYCICDECEKGGNA